MYHALRATEAQFPSEYKDEKLLIKKLRAFKDRMDGRERIKKFLTDESLPFCGNSMM